MGNQTVKLLPLLVLIAVLAFVVLRVRKRIYRKRHPRIVVASPDVPPGHAMQGSGPTKATATCPGSGTMGVQPRLTPGAGGGNLLLCMSCRRPQKANFHGYLLDHDM
jgi:hypothetical protein